jgi:hypothetical protein
MATRTRGSQTKSKAPGKKHRTPPPSIRGAKNDLTIAKSMVAELQRKRAHS